jgi:hypothetical protein
MEKAALHPIGGRFFTPLLSYRARSLAGRQSIELHLSTHSSIATDKVIFPMSIRLQVWVKASDSLNREMSMKTVQQNPDTEMRELTALERAAVSGGRIYWESEEALQAPPPKPPGILSADHNI